MYDNPWLFNGKPFTDDQIDKYQGFVYLIVNKETGNKYIGRKYFHNIRKVKGKKNRQRSESDWKDYYGSSDDLKNDIEKYGVDAFERHILSLHKTRGDCNYQEVKLQFLFNVLEEEGWYNGNISGKYQRKPKHIIESRAVSNLLRNLLTEKAH